jgi:ribosomal protein S6--L-glutamate ligase
MNIGILIFSEPSMEQYTAVDRLVEAGEAEKHSVVKLYEPRLAFLDDKILHDGQPLPELDVIISRPNFIEEPSLRTYAVQKLLQAGYYIVNSTPGYGWAKNKITQHLLFDQHNLPCPRYGLARQPESALTVAKQIGFPVILKVAFGTHGKGVFYAADEQTFTPIAEYLAIRDGNPLIVEEFIEEAKSSDLRVFILGGKIIGAMQRTAQQSDIRANTSTGGTGSVVELSEEECTLALRAAEIFQLEIAGVDLIRSNRGPLTLEVNSNPGFKELESVTGLDIARKIIDYASSQAKN